MSVVALSLKMRNLKCSSNTTFPIYIVRYRPFDRIQSLMACSCHSKSSDFTISLLRKLGHDYIQFYILSVKGLSSIKT
jgi:hypothetical protein